MKIEVAESLLYSWMRHVKDCKIVQTNWKVSSKWKFDHIPDLKKHMSEIAEFLKRNYRFDIFKKNASLNQLVNQGECDVIGINVIDNEMMVYAADVAFHRAGLNYGENIQKVSEKLVRTAFCIYGFTGLKNAEIIFACPKISDKQKEKIKDCVEDIQKKFNDWGFEYSFKFIANEDFFLTILEPVRLVSSKVEDTGELFMRSLQLLDMFYGFSSNDERLQDKWSEKMKPDEASTKIMSEFSIGKLAQVYFSQFANGNLITTDEVGKLLDKKYSKDTLGLNYPCLVKEGAYYEHERYYTSPIEINKQKYYLCNMWFEKNNRVNLERWIKSHLGD